MAGKCGRRQVGKGEGGVATLPPFRGRGSDGAAGRGVGESADGRANTRPLRGANGSDPLSPNPFPPEGGKGRDVRAGLSNSSPARGGGPSQTVEGAGLSSATPDRDPSVSCCRNCHLPIFSRWGAANGPCADQPRSIFRKRACHCMGISYRRISTRVEMVEGPKGQGVIVRRCGPLSKDHQNPVRNRPHHAGDYIALPLNPFWPATACMGTHIKLTSLMF